MNGITVTLGLLALISLAIAIHDFHSRAQRISATNRRLRAQLRYERRRNAQLLDELDAAVDVIAGMNEPTTMPTLQVAK